MKQVNKYFFGFFFWNLFFIFQKSFKDDITFKDHLHHKTLKLYKNIHLFHGYQ